MPIVIECLLKFSQDVTLRLLASLLTVTRIGYMVLMLGWYKVLTGSHEPEAKN